MLIKSIAVTSSGKRLSVSWFSGENDNTLNTISGTEKPLPTFKEAWDGLAAAMWDFLSFSAAPDYSAGRYQRPKKTLRLQKLTFIKTDADKGHIEKVRMELALCPWANMTDTLIMRVPPIYIKTIYTDDDPEECCSAGEASPALFKLIDAVKAEAERYINGERLQLSIPGMASEPVDMAAREIDILAGEQAADQAADKENAPRPIKIIKKKK